jgi:hypothetical protein
MSSRAALTEMLTARMARMARVATKDPDDPAYWLAKADEARAIAETMEYPESRSSMLWVAGAYAIFGDWMKKRTLNYSRSADPRSKMRQPREPARK